MSCLLLHLDAKSSRQWKNQSTVTEFIVLGNQEHCTLLFIVFLTIYLAIFLGNGLTVVVMTWDSALQTPMYFFLRNLSGLEMCYTSVTLPKMMVNLVLGDLSISLPACATQMFFILGAAECFLLAAMAYDSYLAICLPLHYMTVMGHKLQMGLVVGSFAISLPMHLIQIGLIVSLPFCGPNEIDHFFCDIPPVLSLACADVYVSELAVYTENILFVIVPFVLILASYAYIGRTIFHMPAGIDHQKAFSTCSSHVTVVSFFYGSAMIVYLCPQTSDSVKFDKVLSLLYTVIIPLCNPLIYSLRNKEVKASISRFLSWQ